MNSKIKLFLADDQELFRKSLGALLKDNAEFEIAGEAINGKDLVDQLKTTQTDIVLLDIEMPIMDGKTALEIIHKRFPAVKVIMLSMHDNSALTTDFMARGANCYLSKECEVETLFKAIKVVYEEGYFFNKSISKAMLDAILKEKTPSAQLDDVVFNERETEILKKICDGKTNKEIADSLHLSASTIDFHRTKIYSKAKCNNVTTLLKFAIRRGLVALS